MKENDENDKKDIKEKDQQNINDKGQEKNQKTNTDAKKSQDQKDKPLDKDQYIAKLNDDLRQQKKLAEEYFDHLKRNMADFDNFKKRIGKEKDSMYYTITSDIIASFLPIIDDFEKAVNAKCSDESYEDGIKMIYNRLEETLKKLGIEEIDAKGKTFNPDFHEAVIHIDDQNYKEKEVVEVLRKGYKIGDKIVRHAMVKVAN